MDPQVQASFIPKKSLDVSVTTRGSGASSLAFLIALLLFIASIVAAGGAFLYTQYLNTAVAQKSESLQKAEGAYEPEVIKELQRMDARLIESKKLLGRHTAPSGVFTFLGTQTLEKVAFKNFSYTTNPDGSANISMDGDGESFATVALQSDQFNSNKMLKEVVFSSITQGEKGRVNFSVSAVVDPSVLSYANSLGTSVATPSQTTPAPTGSTTPPTGVFPPQ